MVEERRMGGSQTDGGGKKNVVGRADAEEIVKVHDNGILPFVVACHSSQSASAGARIARLMMIRGCGSQQ